MTIRELDISSGDFVRVLAKVLSERGKITMKEPELLMKLRRSGGLFGLTWKEEENGQATGR
jgi:hypothetical protein